MLVSGPKCHPFSCESLTQLSKFDISPFLLALSHTEEVPLPRSRHKTLLFPTTRLPVMYTVSEEVPKTTWFEAVVSAPSPIAVEWKCLAFAELPIARVT